MAIDGHKVINELSSKHTQRNRKGGISAFGAMVSQLPVTFWNGFTDRFLKAAGDGHIDAAEALLEDAAADYGYHTGQSLVTSKEFKAVGNSSPARNPEDILQGVFSILASWGWADAEIVELIPDEKMVVRTHEYYESEVNNPKRPFAYLMRGVSRGLMDLAYGSPYPKGFGKFKCTQTRGIEIGDKYGEFVVTRV